MLSKLQYIANATWPDISFVINRLASHTVNPSMQHHGIVKRILHYLSETKDYGVLVLKFINKTEISNNWCPHVMIQSNSLDAIAQTTNPYMTTSSQHIDLKWHSVKQLVKLNIITPKDVRDTD